MEGAKVEILIDEATHHWNHAVIDVIFIPEKVELIKSIPLPQQEVEDNLFWPFTQTGSYTSKSGYRFLKSEDEVVEDGEQLTQERGLWQGIWSLQVPNKIKNFIRRACRNSLPMKENLVRQTIIEDPLCDRCKCATEFALHALWSCGELDVV